MRRIKNRDKLAKEGLIISLLKSESSDAKRNCMKHFNNNTDDDDTYDDKIRDKISDIRMTLSALGKKVIDNDRKKIRKKLYEIEKKENLSDKEKEKIYDDLVELVKALDKKEEYKDHDRDDLDYYGIRDIENLFDNVNDNDDDYYKPILVEGSFNNNYKYYESRGDNDKKLSVKQYLYKIMPYLSDLIYDHKTNENSSNEWSIQINMHVNFVSSNDTGETSTIFVWNDNEEIRLGNETDIVKGLLNSFLNNYQKEKIILRNGRGFVFESIDLLSYHIHKTSLKRGKSCIKSPEWVVNKRATINPKNGGNKCFQYSITVALHHQDIKNHPERIANIGFHVGLYNWEGIEFPAGIKDCKRFERNNKTIALNILLAPHNEKTNKPRLQIKI